MIATVENMRRAEGRGRVFVYDPSTDVRYSATPGDYFWQPEDEPLLGEDGQPMLLCVEHTMIEELFS
jgi:hypothetical protein